MKKYIFAMLVLVTLLGCKKEPPVPPVTTELNGATYELEFSENFNSMDDINENWNVFNMQFDDSKANNGYHIWAKQENVGIEDGKLCLTARVDKQNKICSGGTITSKESILFKNTMWEIRFKVDKSLGGDWFVFLITPKHKPDSPQGNNWFYLLPNNVEFREMTPIELQTKKGNFRGAAYFFNNVTQKGYNMDTNRLVNVDDSFYNEWHTLKFVWEADEYFCYLDDEIVYQVTKNEVLKSIPENDLYGSIYFGADMMGEWHGAIDTTMPDANYYVDYVKVWRKSKK